MRRISTRLAVSFLIVALLPAVPLSLVVRDLLERRFGPAITEPLESALTAGLEESRGRLHELRARLDRHAGAAAADADTAVVLLDDLGRVQPAATRRAFLEARPQLAAGLTGLTPGEAPARVGDALAVTVASSAGAAPVAVIQPLPDGMVERAGRLTGGLGLLRAVRGEQGRVVLSFVAPFLSVYAVLLVVALAAATLWSRRMVAPLERLVAATRRVARGDLAFRVGGGGPGEVGELVDAFDAMLVRLEEQRRDLARLERAAAWRGMARTLAHEVKNPLTPIVLAVQQVHDRYGGDDPRYRALLDEATEIVTEEVENLRRLVREFGEFARLPRPEPRPGDLVALLRDVSTLYGERVSLASPVDAHAGAFDADALRRALINLVDNGLAACREAEAAERVELRLEPRDDGGATLVVRDRGVGIPPENLDRIFAPDFTTKGGGMGLGLAVVQGIVDGHGGRLDVSSTPRAGTTFRLDLPPAPAAPAGPAPDTADEDGET